MASFAAAGYNVLRVWGGGHPMSTAFYESALAHGLLLWHEFPFACSMVPTDARTKTDAAAETYNIARRISKYPILVYGGNNEISQIHHPVGKDAEAYSDIFFGAVRASLMMVDASRSYLSSSPGSSEETADDPIPSPPQQPSLGDMHECAYKTRSHPILYPPRL